ncbi:3-oxoadipate enol-lactonase [Pseudogemmobacter faecipullorum]|uniref:3-oxoadipate enol-lactonase n=1 Tax=Pseudogemmobacter faecipullorum TaxID=2755041 RepID=A0ABS8CSA4_9RHOB|nr:3-oxoadipate enol-lactonase [Pseudogemmobacter faecipullorum]MCB5412035.1 3-oxoadipate enol-lactonase [Pseudogemmobacter faecipullorum]
MQFLRRPDAILHISDQGPRDGRVVMFANSLGTDLRVWDLLLPLLPADLRVIRFDKPGHGLSDASPAPYSMEGLAADAEAICEALALQNVTFIGLSIGGLIGQALAAKRPDLIQALVLMDTAAKIGSAQMWNSRIAAVRESGLEPMGPAIMERWFTAPYRQERPEFALWTNMLTRTTVEGYTGCCAAIAGADLTESTRALQLPVLVLCGDQDGSTPPELVQATADLITGAEFRLVPEAGHIPCAEQPEATARLITDFLERTTR